PERRPVPGNPAGVGADGVPHDPGLAQPGPADDDQQVEAAVGEGENEAPELVVGRDLDRVIGYSSQLGHLMPPLAAAETIRSAACRLPDPGQANPEHPCGPRRKGVRTLP